MSEIKKKTARRWLTRNCWKIGRINSGRDLNPTPKFLKQHKLCLRVLKKAYGVALK